MGFSLGVYSKEGKQLNESEDMVKDFIKTLYYFSPLQDDDSITCFADIFFTTNTDDWYEYVKDMCYFSMRYPDNIFKLTIYNVDKVFFSSLYFYSGRFGVAEEIVEHPFNEDDLKPFLI